MNAAERGDTVSSPWETVQELLYEHKMDTVQFCAESGMSAQEADRCFVMQPPIDAGLAARLADAFGVPVDFWLTRERHYRESLAAPRTWGGGPW